MKHVLITGGNKGIGLETTKIFLALGYKVTVVARDITPIEGLKNCNAVQFDLRNIAGIGFMVSELGEIDVLVNNAGIMNSLPFDNYSDSAKDNLLKINLEAPVELIKCVSAQMMKRKSGRIVNIASIAGQIGHPDVWYGISKAGILNATKSFAKILGPHGIIVNAVAPGIVETEMLKVIPDSRKEATLRSVFSGRFAQANEIAKTIVWLATDSPAYINGSCIDINDGALVR